MSNNKSSFHMGDEFNGSGKKTYLKATTYKTYKPLSQENIRLTPDYGKYTSKAIGAMAFVTNGNQDAMSKPILKALGGIPRARQIIVSKSEKTGRYETDFEVKKLQLTTGAYLHKSQRMKSNATIENIINELLENTLNHSSKR